MKENTIEQEVLSYVVSMPERAISRKEIIDAAVDVVAAGLCDLEPVQVLATVVGSRLVFFARHPRKANAIY